MSTAIESTRTTACAVCGKDLTVERCFFDGRELFTAAKVKCRDCAAKAEQERIEQKRRDQTTSTQTEWERICPPRFQDTDPARIPDQSAMNQIIGWKSGADGLLALGETGSCKTRSFYLLLRRLHFREKKTIIAINSADLSMEIGRLFYTDQLAAANFIKRLCSVDVLYLDDLDKAKFTERTEAEVYHIINHRTEQRRPIFASVNCNGDELSGLLSDNRGWPIVRRLRDYCKPVCFKSNTLL